MTGFSGIRNRIKPPKIGMNVKGMYGTIDRVGQGGQGSKPMLSEVSNAGAVQGSQYAPRMGATAPASQFGSMNQVPMATGKPKLKFRA